MNSYEQGRVFFEAGQIDRALDSLNAFVRKNPKHFEAVYLLGVCHFKRHHYSDAEKQLRAAVALNNRSYIMYYYLGLALERQSHLDEAIQCYKYTLNLNPGFEKARMKLRRFQPDQTMSQAIRPPSPPSADLRAQAHTKPAKKRKKLSSRTWLGCIWAVIQWFFFLSLGVLVGGLIGGQVLGSDGGAFIGGFAGLIISQIIQGMIIKRER
jgi:tetratricopeptide (TPR) repeat protein